MEKVIIVLPTYNERENIEKIIPAILSQQSKLTKIGLKKYRVSVLVVDDTSPDGTGEIVEEMAAHSKRIFLLRGKKEGLGRAYIRGFQHAVDVLGADVVFEMDADFSHNPDYIPAMLSALENVDFVIGSRYVSGGSIPADWPFLRKLNSRCANILGKYVAGLSSVRDCTGGFRAIRSHVIKKIDFSTLRVKGYAFQISLLHAALKTGARVTEVPIHFVDRVFGTSKIRLKDITEFVKAAFYLRYTSINFFAIITGFVLSLIVGFAFVIVLSIIFQHSSGLSESRMFLIFMVCFSLLMSIQGILTLGWMYYAWSDATHSEKNRSPQIFSPAKVSFTALIPARFEDAVIYHTITSVNNINYPNSLKEIVVILREDDVKTLAEAQRAIKDSNTDRIKLLVLNDFPINKPHSLNAGLFKATGDVVCVFDAEDEPHKDIYSIVNTIYQRDNADVVQSGVQLMNYKSRWFSTFNVLEYFFWFKSALHFFGRVGFIPLGGNTVFFKREWLHRVSGWDETCLTEDADIGIRMSIAGAKISIVYDEQHATQEETPTTLNGFINQRTRWNQGFIQIFFKKDWMKLPSLAQKLFACYLLLSSLIQILPLIYAPVMLYIMLYVKLPVLVALFSFLPLYILTLQLVTYLVGLYHFLRGYSLPISLVSFVRVIVTFFPFQILLGFSAIRAIFRIVQKDINWEKTLHVNAHRSVKTSVTAPAYAVEERI